MSVSACPLPPAYQLGHITLAFLLHSNSQHHLCARRARIDTLSKARYGTLLKQLGGWSWMQDVLQVGNCRVLRVIIRM
jgi:hypothetical protein